MLLCLLMVLALAPAAVAQDPAEVDADHYTVVFENEHVRVLRINYGPGEKSVMHYHPDGVAVFLNDQTVQFTMPDGTTQDAPSKAGDVIWAPGGLHLPANAGDGPLEVILVEVKASQVDH
jgi:quercetin dioxygenase-like cupin family protein